MEIGTYQTIPEKRGHGTFYFTSCGHKMYSVRDKMAYNGCLCPACFQNGIIRTLYFKDYK